MDNFAEALAAVENLKRERIVEEYAIGGAMALIFWSEPTPTFDLDVFVLLASPAPLVSLDTIYAWARRKEYKEIAEHIEIAGVPVQFIPAPNALTEEAIRTAADMDYEGQPVRVIRPEYLIALALEPGARTRKRVARVNELLDEGVVDPNVVHELLTRYNLKLPE